MSTFHNLYPNTAPKMSFKEGMKAMYEILYKSSSKIPMHKIPQCKPDLALFEKNEEAFKFIWFGHSTLLLHLEGLKILIDPMFSTYASPIAGTFKRFQPPVLIY